MENLTKVERLSLDSILLSRKKVKIRCVLKDKTKGLVLILTNVFYFFNNLLKLISLGFLNSARIYYHNKDQILDNLKI